MSGTASTSIDETSTRYFPFDGTDPSKWREWSQKVLSVGRRKKWAAALLNDYANEGVTDASLNTTQQDQVEKNDNAWNYLIASCTDKAFDIIDLKGSADRVDPPNQRDNAFAAWEALMKKFQPTDSDAYVKLMEEFAGCKLQNKKDDPEDWITKMNLINRRLRGMGKGKDEEEIIATILAGLPEEYESIK